jgi:hypothetical protein
MNLKRGFLRLWIAVSVTWLTIVGALLIPSFQSVYAPIRINVGQHEVEIPANLSRDKLEAAVVTFLKEYAAGKPEYQSASIDYVGAAKEVIAQYRPRSFVDPVLELLKFGFGPPLTLLVLGMVVWWIGAGFREKPNHQP